MVDFRTGAWTPEEHERFLIGIQKYPKGPWRKVAEIIETRTIRQTQTHGHKFRLKLARHEAKRARSNEKAFQYPVSPATHILDEMPPEDLPPLAHALDFMIQQLDEPDAQIAADESLKELIK
ncbi:hypothetical protein THRCLA_20996 [Thraustotheca clavata]|uniref:Uncharacterized protein n=1 Tax=Thraustotheca clavata TaxID=74557 RepID=A0A1W0A179_9STRA|nr:hypothetical protein THRCLA_20996 [Thraustotheca clavata]